MSDFCNHCKKYFDDDIAWEDNQTGLMFCSEECLDVHFNEVEAGIVGDETPDTSAKG